MNSTTDTETAAPEYATLRTSLPLRSLLSKFVLLCAPILIFLNATFLYGYSDYRIEQMRGKLATKIAALSVRITRELRAPLQRHDWETGRNVLTAVSGHREVICAEVAVPEEGIVLSWPGVGCGSIEEDGIAYKRKIRRNRKVLGTFRIKFRDKIIEDNLRQEIFYIVLALVFSGLAVFVAAIFAHRFTIGRPLDKLLRSIRCMEEENVRTHVEWRSSDELGIVIDAYNSMTEIAERRTQEIKELVWASNSANEELRRSAAALGESEARTRAIVDNMKDAVITHGEDRAIATFSSSAQNFFGYTSEEAIFQPIDMLISESEIDDEGRSFLEDWRSNEISDLPTHPVELVARRKDGSTFPAEISVGIFNEQNLTIIITLRDITRRKDEQTKQEELENLLRQSQRMEAIGTLAAGIAHEINTPLQYVTSNFAFLKDGIEAIASTFSDIESAETTKTDELEAVFEKHDVAFFREEMPQAITQGMDGMAQISRIIQAVKQFSHPGEGEKEPLDLADIIDGAMEVTKNVWKNVAQVTCEIPDNLPTVMGYPGEIGQVLLNLIANAAQAIEENSDGEQGKIIIGVSDVSGFAEIRVADNGPGIPPDKIDQIFDLFFTTKAPGKGTGQGLAICKSFIETKHGGKLLVKSELGKGTTFVIRLPLELVQP